MFGIFGSGRPAPFFGEGRRAGNGVNDPSCQRDEASTKSRRSWGVGLGEVPHQGEEEAPRPLGDRRSCAQDSPRPCLPDLITRSLYQVSQETGRRVSGFCEPHGKLSAPKEGAVGTSHVQSVGQEHRYSPGLQAACK